MRERSDVRQDDYRSVLAPPSSARIFDTKFKTGQQVMLSLAPSPIRSDLRKIFAFDNRLFDELSKAGWDAALVPRIYWKTWAVAGSKLRPAAAKVIRYLDATCGFKLAKP